MLSNYLINKWCINKKDTLKRKFPKKWPKILSLGYNVKWNKVWKYNCYKKYFNFIWGCFYKILAFNV